MKITILGAGVTGLSLAWLCESDGHEIRILERSSSPGGLCRSSILEGFTMDHAGGHILYSKDREVLDWMLDRVGRKNLVQKKRNTRIRWHDLFIPYPFENGIGHLPPEVRFECLKGYLESVGRRRRGDPQPGNFHDWILWKMGEGLARHFMLPYNEKIWGCDLHEMGSSWVAGRVPDAPLDDILRAAVGLSTEGYTHQSVFWFPLHGGFQALTDGIARDLKGEIRLDTALESVRRKGAAWLVNDEECDLVVSTIPLPELVPVFEGVPEGIRGEVAGLRPISLVNVLFGVRREEPLEDLSWVYLPFTDQGPANRVTFFSNYSPGNAPPGHVSFMAEVTHRGDLEVTESWIADLAESMEKVGFFSLKDLVFHRAFESRYAYIDLNLAFPQRIARVREWFDASGLISYGRFGRYEYHNSDQCIRRSFEVRAHIERFARSGDQAPLELP